MNLGDGRLCVGRPFAGRGVQGDGPCWVGLGGCASDDALAGRGIWRLRGRAGRRAVFFGCGGCAMDDALAGSGVLGGTWRCVGGMVKGEVVVQQTTRWRQ